MKGKVMLGGLLASLLVISLFGGWLFYQQPAMIFFPSQQLVSTPSDWGLAYEEVSLTTADGLGLHGWYIPEEGANRTLLFFHGNAGNISHRGDSVLIFHRLGLNVLIFDYRGYGGSQGKPTEAGLYQDARAAWQYLVEEKGISPQQIILFGRSLGGAVATKLAIEVQPAALILESTFSSARDMAQAVFPVMSRIVPMRFAFETVQNIQQVNAPLLMVHSREDEIIPYKLGQKVYQAAKQPKSFVTIHGDHNQGFLRSQPEYEQALARFLATVTEDSS